MPAALREHQHELMSVDGTRGLVFGTEDTGYLTLTRPIMVSGEIRTNDTDMPQEDGRNFGRDYISGKSMTFEAGVLTDSYNTVLAGRTSHRANLDALDRFQSFWEDEEWRATPRSMAVLRTREGGQTWRAYGRPTKYDEVAGRTTAEGYTPILFEFRLRDNSWYADTESVVDTKLAPSPEGALIAPLVAPLRTTVVTSALVVARVAGTKATWPVIEIHGPADNPRVTIGERVYGIDTYITEGDSVIIDTRPWVRSVIRTSDGAGLAGALTWTTPALAKSRLDPGTYNIRFDAVSTTGTAWAQIRWRNARARP